MLSGSTKDIRHIGIANKGLRNELSNLGHLFSILGKNRDYDYVESESGGDDASDGVFKHAQVSLEFELKRRKVQSEDDV